MAERRREDGVFQLFASERSTRGSSVIGLVARGGR